MIRLVDIDKICPSTYNPRKSDPQRLDFLEISLRKIGFVLPIVATAKGEILSGHQRHHVATRIGAKRIPVLFTDDFSLERRKALNILFNRATNDMTRSDNEKKLTAKLHASQLEEMVRGMEDVEIDSDRFVPCMHIEMVASERLGAANPIGSVDESMVGAARQLMLQGVDMPIVAVRETLRVVNGMGRMCALMEEGAKTIPVSWISQSQADLAAALLNYLTMDFDIHTRYANELRYNSFRRSQGTRDHLGIGFTFMLTGADPSNRFDHRNPKHIQRWMGVHGRHVVDFGAGQLQETEMLRSMGVKPYPFEPYRLGAFNEIDKGKAVGTAREFLGAVAAGTTFSSVFISAVLNSVPFREDREKIVRILAALCGPTSTCFACSISNENADFLSRVGLAVLNDQSRARSSAFALSYEENITIGELTGKPKMQKFHSLEEWGELFRTGFQLVKAYRPKNGYVAAVCRSPHPVNPGALREALMFEFELPYPDGTTMGLGEEACRAFSKRLGMEV